MGRRTPKPYLGITMGDPAGIGPEVVAKALAGQEVRRVCRPIVIGSQDVMERTVHALRLPVRVRPVEGHEAGERPNEIRVLDPLEKPLGRFQMGRAADTTGAASVAYVTTAVRLAQTGCTAGVVTWSG
jgi:4-hydroxy-L-threonine phosphate dehydrogenase PdxA